MAIRQDGTELLVGFRRPALLAIVDTLNGNLRAVTPSCGDADDILVDEKRSRAYVSCGQGFHRCFELDDASASRIDHILSTAGARTALDDPELDRVFLAVKATSGTSAAICASSHKDLELNLIQSVSSASVLDVEATAVTNWRRGYKQLSSRGSRVARS